MPNSPPVRTCSLCPCGDHRILPPLRGGDPPLSTKKFWFKMVSPGPGWIQGWTSSSEGGCHPFGGLLLHFKSTSVLDVPGLHESWDWTRIDASDKTPATNCGKTAVVVERFTFGLKRFAICWFHLPRLSSDMWSDNCTDCTALRVAAWNLI